MESSHACTGSSTPRGPRTARDSAASGIAFRRFRARRHPGQAQFRGSIAGLRAPLSTLRCALTGRQRMTQGHRDSLDLRCRTLSFPSLMPVVRRFPETRARRCGSNRVGPAADGVALPRIAIRPVRAAVAITRSPTQSRAVRRRRTESSRRAHCPDLRLGANACAVAAPTIPAKRSSRYSRRTAVGRQGDRPPRADGSGKAIVRTAAGARSRLGGCGRRI